MKENDCSYKKKDGYTSSTCQDMPVTFCPKCKRFYVLDRQGGRTEISIHSNEEEE